MANKSNSERAGVLYRTIMAYKKAGVNDLAPAPRDKTSSRGSMVKQYFYLKKKAKQEKDLKEQMRREKSSA